MLRSMVFMSKTHRYITKKQSDFFDQFVKKMVCWNGFKFGQTLTC